MSLEHKLRSAILNVAFNQRVLKAKRNLAEKRRRARRQPHVVTAFLQIDDPYSYILSRYLPRLATHFDIELKVCFSQAIGGEYQPAPEMLAEYSITDCSRLAEELGIPFLDKGKLPPTEHRKGLSDAIAGTAGQQNFAGMFYQGLAAFWRGDSAAAAEISSTSGRDCPTNRLISDAQKEQLRMGHYNSAMLHYAGEWYWGVDRLHYLIERLDELGAARVDSSDSLLASIDQAMRVSLPVSPPSSARDLPTIEFFFSFRSPYSYLALRRSFEIADAFGIEIIARPVLPMVMRGMEVPRRKLLYIAADTFREASLKNIQFGKIADPIGSGVERCHAVLRYAESENRVRDFLFSAGSAIWSEAIDVSTDKGMRRVTDRAGLFWPDVVDAMRDDSWRESEEANRESMMNAGSWGVPTIRMGEFVVWGQDRDWLLIRHIEELCDKGEGIIV